MYVDLTPKGLVELRQQFDRSASAEIRVSYDLLISLIAEIEKLRVESARLRRSI